MPQITLTLGHIWSRNKLIFSPAHTALYRSITFIVFCCWYLENWKDSSRCLSKTHANQRIWDKSLENIGHNRIGDIKGTANF